MYILVYTLYINIKYMKTKIQKWGNSFGVRLPMEIINKKGLFDGASLQISEDKENIILKYSPEKKKESLRIISNKITPDNLHSETDWGGVRGKELW